MKKTIYFFYIIGAIIILNSCKQTCPAFSEEHLKWMPYENTSEIKFTNNTDTITFKIENFNKSEEEKYNNWRFEVSCFPSANFATNVEEQQNISISGLAQTLENSNDVDYSYSFYCPDLYSDVFYFELKDNIIGGFGRMHDTTIVIDNINLTNAFYLRDETNSRIKEIYIGEGYGIVKYVEINNTEWTLIIE